MKGISLAIEKRLHADRRTFELAVRFDSAAEVTVLFGPSGAGKTLTLHAIAGLLRPDRGEIRIDDRLVFSSALRIDVAARQRGIGFVFQDYALFPHLTVAQNVAFGLHRGWLNGGTRAVRSELLAPFDLQTLAHAYPADLSGGQRQRVALARALARQPQLLLLDEPFASLDAPLRTRMRSELLALRRRHDVPMIVITHDPDDVTALGGQVVHLDNGRVVG